MKVAVVILNWNGKSLLEQFLPSVLAHSKEANIYVADNASTDDSLHFLSEHYPQVDVIQNSENGGYAKGYNDALINLTEDVFVLLNNDVEVTKGWLTPMITAFENDPSLVAAQPKILDYKDKSYFEYAGAGGGFIDRLGYPYCRGRIFNTLEVDEGQYDDVISIFWATGACLFVRNEAFWEVGGLDEDLFAHMEEIDLCWRLQIRGGAIKYFGNSTLYHLGGATLTAANPKKTFYNFRNSLLILLKNVKGFVAWRRIFIRMLWDGVAGILFLLQGKPSHFLAVIKAHISFYRLLPKFLKKRKKWASDLSYSTINSIVWKYFIAKKRNFNNL
ncbi:MAG: glycosyltransferase family 2 protein [Flavobacteriaceae bacterium]|nr:glycosyltransferase family 2 protein [Flavobacteriaceae bacterium]